MPTIERTPEAERIIEDLIVTQGMSYARAARFCEAQAERLAAPYLEVAAELRAALSSHEEAQP